MDFEELNAKGWAEVIEERPCPKIAPGPGRVVTATITHANDDVRTLTLGSGEVLHVTGNHRMFSATRQDWVPVKDLHIGEALRTTKGRESVAALGYQKGRHQVYNLEVETEHCYFVGNGEVLTHNTCGPDGQSLALTHSDQGAAEQNTKTLNQWLDNDPALLKEVSDGNKKSPEWHGIDPAKTPVYLRPEKDVKAIRAKPGERGGHHPHGLALGGPEGQKLTKTGDTKKSVNPMHAKATGLQKRIINAIKRKTR